MDFLKLINEVGEWSTKNFGQEPALNKVFGLIEETGELAHAHLKMKQNIRSAKVEDKQDAIGDIIIYLADYCHTTRKRPAVEWRDQSYIDHVKDVCGDADQTLCFLGSTVGMLCANTIAHMTDDLTNTTAEQSICDVYLVCKAYAEISGFDFDKTVQSVWDKVNKRDWVKLPETGD